LREHLLNKQNRYVKILFHNFYFIDIIALCIFVKLFNKNYLSRILAKDHRRFRLYRN